MDTLTRMKTGQIHGETTHRVVDSVVECVVEAKGNNACPSKGKATQNKRLLSDKINGVKIE